MAGLVSLSGETNLFVQSVFAIVVKGHWKHLLKPKISSSLTSISIHQILFRLSFYCSGPSLSWAFFKWVELIPDYKHSLQSSWTMVCILTEHRHFKTAQNLLENIARKDFMSSPSVLNCLATTCDNPDVNAHIFSWLMIIYVNCKMSQDAIQVLEYMRLHGIRPHLHACTVLLNSLAKDRLTDMVWKIYKKMVQIGVLPNIHIYNVLIHACCKSGDVEKAEQILSEMELKSVFPDLYTYNTLISLYSKKSMHYEALCVQDRMERGGIRPDIVTYNALIYGFCKESRMREAVKLFREIKDASPNHVTYTTLIDGYCRVNDLEEALRLCKVMEAKGLHLGVVTYNSILRKLCEEGRIRDANKLLNEMAERKVEPDNVTCNTLINAYCKIGDMKSALKVKNKMLDAGLQLDSFTYKALIHGFCRVRDMESAKEVLFSMLDVGLCPAYCTYSWLVDGYCEQGNEGAIISLLDEFLTRGTCVDVSVCRALIRRLCHKEKVGYAEKIYHSMEHRGISGDSVIYTSLAYAYWKEGKSNLALGMLCEMTKRRLMVTLKIYRCFNASYGCDNRILHLFWDHVAERGLMSRSITVEIRKMNLQTG
ncbi:pentatricopeptide repeat-containing protein At5g38730 [Momordica charantia]|uniref:Pentatricopeptide repeat-containing protein At5g38730 n=1 Tax=Momordica charantia TaxID=3673 RepID=A0A6J1DZ68_MOMCH|nr:pentatricopeptide repeat-containing protein At5g38730 [Momordica charantia]XP_022157770.1 pentatricopeptide repeat-containing protein At5g38730 [Momordica charantia]XP_022157771.1 pentatricopeptide repeat-containing protein At5g38730 [Momordica charantia]